MLTSGSNENDIIIRKQIEKVDFGFYTDKDVRDRSVCEITSSVAVDQLGTALPNGVYDPRMGCSSAESPPCSTCALRYLQCPGHFGHIELCVPVYHPLLFHKLLDLLRIKCINCHRFQISKRMIKMYETKFALLEHGRYNDAIELDDRLAGIVKKTEKSSSKSKDIDQDDDDEALEASNVAEEASGKLSIRGAALRVDKILSDINKSLSLASRVRPASKELSTMEIDYHRQVAKEFVQACKSTRSCPHCGGYSPKIRQDSSNKIFQAALSQKYKRLNEGQGIYKLQPALSAQTSETENVKPDDKDKDSSDKDKNKNDGDDERDNTPGRDKYMHPAEVQAQLKRTWEISPALCQSIFAIDGYEVFFMQAVPVPPNRFRPPMTLGSMMVEHAQNSFLNKILQTNEIVRENFANGDEARAYQRWIDLQTHLNCYMDSSKDPAGTGTLTTGIRQLLERKEGIFRKHMMGKRVNFACRSVISPDPYIGTNEIGIPRHFAHTLTYPTPVTDINIELMRKLVERGPNQYPGARWVEFPDRRVDLSKMDLHKREAVAAQMLKCAKRGDGRPAIVGRQLQDGDMVLMNRQPTLHKPGIMAHEVRILQNPTQKTIRMHYANCNTYNADYDGDEMNCHFPQSDLARAEAEYVAKTDLQFIVPTDGSPLRGLIQDHVVAGVKLTKKDTFLEKWEYQQLLFAALASLPRLELIRCDANIELMPPAIIKPKPLWTGKQVISTLLNHLRQGNNRDKEGTKPFPGISTERKAKTPNSAFGNENDEGHVIIRDGELLRGVLDKAAYGATDFSLVHAVYESYGPSKAGLLLNSLGRLFTAYIQFFSGHSCRMEDLILTKESDKVRRKLIDKAYNTGARSAKAWSDSEGGKVPIELNKKNASKPLKPVESASAASRVSDLLSGADGKNNSAAFDGFMMSKLNPLASDIVKACLPDGLAVSFPTNTFSIMCSTGAKGSIVNQSQVSCALGQQALEGRRVPRLASGRTLPSFAPYDVNPRADGFVMDRFLTGIRPQEYYFHCMAGREGLVDTAVKTSRSGYLQRCLVKHLEELKVCYDYTVRNGEGGVVQFLYGEDGLDPTKASYLDCSEKSFVYMARNCESLKRGQTPLPNPSIVTATNDERRSKAVSKRGSQTDLLQVGDFVLARRLRVGTEWDRGTLCEGWHDATILKIGKRKRYNLKYMKDGHIEKNVPLEVEFTPNGSLSNTCVLIKAAAPDPVISSSRPGHRLGTNGTCVSEFVAGAAADALSDSKKLKQAMTSSGVSNDEFSSLVAAKYGAALCAPGEAVGCIAAQSIGEPSTQMTLNTFHLAGAGANVTLGIPRLREIIMTASRTLKTPTMSVPLHKDVKETEAVKLARSFKKLTLNEVIASHQGIKVDETLMENDNGKWERAYLVTLKFHPAERIKAAFGLTLSEIAKVVAKSFVPALSYQMKLELRRAAADGEGVVSVEGGESTVYVHHETEKNENTNQQKEEEKDELEEDDDAISVEGGIEDGVTASRTQGEAYGERDDDERKAEEEDDDEKSIASEDSSSDAKAATTSTTNIGDFVGDSGIKVNTKSNMIKLQPLRVDPSARPLLMVGLVEKAASKILVRARKDIDEAFLNEEEDGRGKCLQTAGINFEEIWKLESVDHNRLMSNDIWAVRCAYGVEAARQSIKDQIRGVFGVYGIEVDPRHLSLIADYMTYTGNYTAMNRNGMKEMSSPFLQMSFETTAQFLTEASLRAGSDELNSPSASIVVGRPVRHGTGAFSLLVK